MASTDTEQDQLWMQLALKLAGDAAEQDEVPVGAVVVKDGQLIASAFNERESRRSPLAHAELLAIERAAAALGAWRLVGCTLYVTLEPCLMCCGAIQLSRIPRVVYGTRDPKGGGYGSLYDFHSDPRLNHRPQVEEGLLAEDSAHVLKEFFRLKRAKS